MKTTKKMIVSDGFVRCGHVAIRADRLIEVEGKGINAKMMEHRHWLCPIDRVVSDQEFVDLTRLVVARGPLIIRAKSKRKIKTVAKQVSNFIR